MQVASRLLAVLAPGLPTELGGACPPSGPGLSRPNPGILIEDPVVGPGPVQDCCVGAFGCSILPRSAATISPTRAELDGSIMGPARPRVSA
jgi:hypothetical protein